tara:strand:- start:208 stop:387 length:180 start_codon:yes stop_codon:yes gene_type:complete
MELNKMMQLMYETLVSTDSDLEKFDNGNKSAGTRIRKAMQEIKLLAQQIRVKVQDIKNG